MKVTLVSMPWASPERPPFPLELLASVIRSESGWDVVVVPAYLAWLRMLLDADLDPPFRTQEYERARGGTVTGIGEWVFSAVLRGAPPDEPDGFVDQLRSRGLDPGRAPQLRHLAPTFITTLAEGIVAERPDVVGCSTSFAQNTASLALLREIRSLDPSIVTVLGGANCDGEMGEALHRCFPQVDAVVRGEGEPVIVPVLEGLTQPDPQVRREALRTIPGLCWRDAGEQRVNPGGHEPWSGFATRPPPERGAYLDAVERLGLRTQFEPRFLVEGSRGCWWGEKHHCAFCGLNGAQIATRIRPAEAVFAEIEELATRYGARGVVAVDNNLPREHFRELLPRLADAKLGVRIHYEVKSNLTQDEVSLLVAAGVTNFQAGVESLSSSVLRLVDKGVTAVHNVRTLRYATSYRAKLHWNLLYGFPGEDPEDYEAMIDRMPDLWHLQPPMQTLRVSLVRFAPYFEDPSLGFVPRQPVVGFYPYVYPDLTDADRSQLAYHFDSPPRGIDVALATRLEAAVERWQHEHARAHLWWSTGSDADVIRDGRDGLRTVVVDDPDERHLLRQAVHGVSIASLQRRHRDADRYLARWRDARLVFEDDGRLVTLPLPDPRTLPRWPPSELIAGQSDVAEGGVGRQEPVAR